MTKMSEYYNMPIVGKCYTPEDVTRFDDRPEVDAVGFWLPLRKDGKLCYQFCKSSTEDSVEIDEY